MKKIAMSLSAMAMLFGMTVFAQSQRSFTGEIMDTNCAKTGAHHKGMDAKACTADCVDRGGKYVLYNAETKQTYELDDQTKPASFAGAKVIVTGTYDRDSKTIYVADIKAAS